MTPRSAPRRPRCASLFRALSLVAVAGGCGRLAPLDDGSPGDDPRAVAAPSPDARPRLVLFGGSALTALLDDTWVWSEGAWTRADVSGPPARSGHAMVTLGGTAVLFGGLAAMNRGLPLTALNDTWAWDGSRWTLLASSGPSPRVHPAMAALRDKIVLFGGEAGDGAALGDTWEWDGVAWTQRDVVGPGARQGAKAATRGDRVILTGGDDLGPSDPAPNHFTDTWAWDGSTWSQLDAPAPEARAGVAATYGAEILLFGGDDTTTSAWNGSAWRPRGRGAPPPRESPAMATSAPEAILFGGLIRADSWVVTSDTWSFDGEAWTLEEGAAPAARWDAAMAAFRNGEIADGVRASGSSRRSDRGRRRWRSSPS